MMKTITTYILVLLSSLISTFTYAQTCTRQIPSFNAAPGGYVINGDGVLESVNDVITLYFNENFSTQSGPDLFVYLATNFEAPSAPGNTNVELGELISNSGAQSYAVPSGVSLDQYSYVLIHCKVFNHWWGGGMLGAIDCSTATHKANDNIKTSIYPNPTEGIIYFPLAEPVTRIQIYNSSGQLIYSLDGINSQQLDLSPFGIGTFILRMSNEKSSLTTKVVVQ